MNKYTVKLSDNGNIAVDDTILVKDVQSAAGSRILEGFKPLFSAEAVSRLEQAGYVISGKTHVGEFGLDLVGEFSYYAEKKEELKGAAAEVVAAGEVKAALGVDMNGTTRRAAALSGVDFLKPTYGSVSRYGIISCAASGEQLGVYGADVAGIKEVMEVIAGHDEKDGTSLREEKYSYSIDEPVAGKKVCIIKELLAKADEDTVLYAKWEELPDDSLYTNLNSAVADISLIADRLERGEGTLGRLLSSDDSLYTNLNSAVADISSIADRLERGEGTLGKLLSSDDEMYTNLNATVENLRIVSDRLVTGQGTLGKLLSEDDELYGNVNGAVTDVREMLDDMREANTLSTFSGLLFGGF